MQQHSLKFSGIFRSVWLNRFLVFSLARREIASRYRGSFLGFLWSFINPLIMLAVYTFVFSSVFQARWDRPIANKGEFAVILFCGLIIFNFFSEVIARSPNLILAHSTYVKKVVFPLEDLIWVSIFSAAFNMFTSLIILMFFDFALDTSIHWTIIFFPLVIFPLVMFVAGLAWLLSSLGVFLRDTGPIVALGVTILLFLSPIFYPLKEVPEKFQFLFQFNPLSYIIEEARNVVLWGLFPNWTKLGLYSLASLLVAWLGFVWFQKTRKGFADVI